MKLVDVNVLLYAVNEDDPRHAKVLSWWETAFNGSESIGFAWSVLQGYLRLATHPRVMPRPQSPREAVDQVNRWLDQPNARIAVESANHWNILRQLILEVGIVGNLMSDAHLAALAVSHGMTLVSCDADFGRFRQLRWENPAI